MRQFGGPSLAICSMYDIYVLGLPCAVYVPDYHLSALAYMSVAPSWLSPLPASTTSALPTCIGPSCPPSSVTLLRHAAGKAALVAPRVHLEQFRPPLPSGCNTYAHDELMSAVMVHIARSWRGSSALPHAAQPSSAFQPAHSC